MKHYQYRIKNNWFPNLVINWENSSNCWNAKVYILCQSAAKLRNKKVQRLSKGYHRRNIYENNRVEYTQVSGNGEHPTILDEGDDIV